MPLDSCKKSVNHASALIASKFSIIQCWFLVFVNFVRRTHIGSLFAKIIIQIIAVICLITNKLIRLCFNQIKLRSQLNLRHFMMVHSMSTNSNLQTDTVNNAKDFMSAPLLKTTMNSFKMWVILRKHLPLSLCMLYSQYSFHYSASWDRFSFRMPTPQASIRKAHPYQFPLLVFQSHAYKSAVLVYG